MSSHPAPHGSVPAVPLHRTPRALLAVGAGGALGTSVRAAADAILGTAPPLPPATLTVNLVGAFALGLLLGRLAGLGPDEGTRRDLRLLAGTGVLGGFTTYSSFAAQGAALLLAGRPAGFLLHAGLSLVGGLLAALAGGALAGGLPGRRGRPTGAGEER